MAIVLVAFITPLAILLSVQFGPLGPPVALALIAAPVYYFNKARKHGRSEAFDDRLTDERMRVAQEEIESIWKKRPTEE
jgi:hypothetical protein